MGGGKGEGDGLVGEGLMSREYNGEGVAEVEVGVGGYFEGL